MKALALTVLGALAVVGAASSECAAWQALVFDDSVTIGVRRPYSSVVPYGFYASRSYRVRAYYRRKSRHDRQR
jgi:hypothetical protein